MVGAPMAATPDLVSRAHLFAALLLLQAPATATGQATHISAPPRETLLSFVYEWSEESALHNLRTLSMGPDDVEVRFWQGFGLAGTWATVLRRRAGQWQAWRAQVQRCFAMLPPAVADTMSQRTRASYRRQARRACRDPRADTLAVALMLSADPVALYPLGAGDYEAFWQGLKAQGILELPPSVPRTWLMLDGHTYVVEVRRGGDYRASVIEHTRPEVRADTLVQHLAQMVDRISQ